MDLSQVRDSLPSTPDRALALIPNIKFLLTCIFGRPLFNKSRQHKPILVFIFMPKRSMRGVYHSLSSRPPLSPPFPELRTISCGYGYAYYRGVPLKVWFRFGAIAIAGASDWSQDLFHAVPAQPAITRIRVLVEERLVEDPESWGTQKSLASMTCPVLSPSQTSGTRIP